MTNTMTFATKRIVEIHGNPIGKTFTFEVKREDGIVYTYSGVTCVVDGGRDAFRLRERCAGVDQEGGNMIKQRICRWLGHSWQYVKVLTASPARTVCLERCRRCGAEREFDQQDYH